MISDERAEQALDYLQSTTGAIGAAKAELERSEILRKRVRKKVFLSCDGTVAERDARAECDLESQEADDRYISAIQEYESLRAKRDIETIALDVWRTESANRRRL
jgi:Mg-chelatase subunit ChlI